MPLDDETRNQMLDVLQGTQSEGSPGEPGKASLLSEDDRKQMRDTLGIPPLIQPWGAIKEKPEEEPGYLGTIAGGLYTGVRRRFPEQIGQAIQTATRPLLAEGAVSPGEKMVEWAREGEKRPEFKSAIKENIYQGLEMLAPSILPSVALGPLGLGATATGAITGGIFGLSQFQQTMEAAKQAGVEPGFAPYATGAIEALGETAGTIYLTRLFGPLAPLFKLKRGEVEEGKWI